MIMNKYMMKIELILFESISNFRKCEKDNK